MRARAAIDPAAMQDADAFWPVWLESLQI